MTPERTLAARHARHLAALVGLLTALALSACGGNDNTTPTKTPPAALVDVQAEAAGANCANGGSRVLSGLDTNDNKTLDGAEVTSTQYVCNGAPGTTGSAGLATLVQVTDAGAHCATGGKAINVGIDANADGTLDAAEIASTDYVCSGTAGTNGATGANGLDSLLATVAEPSGANCQWGGMKTTSGLDANANHVLDASEVTATTYVCNGAPAASSNIVDVTTASVQAQVNTSYMADSASPVTVTLPANPAVGDVVIVSGVGSGGWTIAQNAGQRIYTGIQNADWNGLAAQPFQSNAIAVSGNGKVYALGGFFTDIQVSVDGGATFVDQAGSGSTIWQMMAASYDGSHMMASNSAGQIWVSNDTGATWLTTPMTSGNWSAFTISPDGSHMAATPYGGDIWESADGGLTWVDVAAAGNRTWNGIAMSADGMKQIAAEQGNALYLSTDGGATWTTASAPTGKGWTAVTSSSDGVHLFAAAYSDFVYTSDDSGATWTQHGANSRWQGATSSADGRFLAAYADSGMTAYIYTSADYGVTWHLQTGAASDYWRGIASTADGMTVVAIDSYSYMEIARAATTPGVTGALTGGQYATVTLQYTTGGVFNVIASQGTPTVH